LAWHSQPARRSAFGAGHGALCAARASQAVAAQDAEGMAEVTAAAADALPAWWVARLAVCSAGVASAEEQATAWRCDFSCFGEEGGGEG
jgi:hypothetical protein